jgi:hypothetical protein
MAARATAASAEKPQDRVAMLSLSADGTPDQINPVVIGNKDAATDAAKRQFVEQALSDADEPHEAVAAAAEKRAVSVIGTLHKG